MLCLWDLMHKVFYGGLRTTDIWNFTLVRLTSQELGVKKSSSGIEQARRFPRVFFLKEGEELAWHSLLNGVVWKPQHA